MRSVRVALLLIVAVGAVAAAAGARTNDPPPPVSGRFVNIEPTSGTTLYHAPGATPTRLTKEIRVPVNTIVDATHGRMGLTSANGSADFYDGTFVVREPKNGHVTQLWLAAERTSTCKAGSKTVVGQLWGDGKGSFQTRGKYAAATVRGTKWHVQDRCDGTLVTVTSGVVAVRDFKLGKTVLVTAGHSYLARS